MTRARERERPRSRRSQAVADEIRGRGPDRTSSPRTTERPAPARSGVAPDAAAARRTHGRPAAARVGARRGGPPAGHPASVGGGSRPGPRLLLHLVQPDVLEPGEDRLPAARALLQRRHARSCGGTCGWRRRPGINGFLVSLEAHPAARRPSRPSWSRSPGRRTSGCGIVYQGLDFARTPLAVRHRPRRPDVLRDPVRHRPGLRHLRQAGGGLDRQRPLHRRADPADHRRRRAGKLLVLGNAKSLEDVESREGALDGQAYYWSSVDPVAGASRAEAGARCPGRCDQRAAGCGSPR